MVQPCRTGCLPAWPTRDQGRADASPQQEQSGARGPQNRWPADHTGDPLSNGTAFRFRGGRL